MSGAGHALILGTSKTGKTTLAKQLAQARVASGAECIVLDPFNGQWPTRYVYTDPQKFLATARASTRCLLVIDESGRAIGRGKQARGMEWVTTQARHWGHQAILLAQTPQQIDPKDRSCTIGTLSCGPDAIIVGAYSTAIGHLGPWGLSGHGPSRRGDIFKPDLSAPGHYISLVRSRRGNGQSATLASVTGTSVAAPFVTGTIACVYERAPQPRPIMPSS